MAWAHGEHGIELSAATNRGDGEYVALSPTQYARLCDTGGVSELLAVFAPHAACENEHEECAPNWCGRWRGCNVGAQPRSRESLRPSAGDARDVTPLFWGYFIQRRRTACASPLALLRCVEPSVAARLQGDKAAGRELDRLVEVALEQGGVAAAAVATGK